MYMWYAFYTIINPTFRNVITSLYLQTYAVLMDWSDGAELGGGETQPCVVTPGIYSPRYDQCEVLDAVGVSERAHNILMRENTSAMARRFCPVTLGYQRANVVLQTNRKQIACFEDWAIFHHL